jgi:hypothetical protein
MRIAREGPARSFDEVETFSAAIAVPYRESIWILAASREVG